MRKALALCLLGCATLSAQNPFPANSTALPDHPYFIKKTWVIGGHGNWDYLTMDPSANRLYIAHGPEVQVVDVETGNLVGAVGGLRQAHAVVLDENGQFGYVTDGPADQVIVFDRRTLEVQASIPTGPAPRALALDSEANLLIAICAGPNAPPPAPDTQTQPQHGPPRRPAQRPMVPGPRDEEIKSMISVIDPETRAELARIVVAGHLGFVQTDNRGAAFIAVENRSAILRLDLDALASQLRRPPSAADTRPNSSPRSRSVDWSDALHPPRNMPMHVLSNLSGCRIPRALAIDTRHLRLFAACENQKLMVINSGTGETVTTLPTGFGTEAIGYDADRGLIYSANGGGDGSLTVIRQDVTDTYAVIQTLPTRQQARTLAVDSSSGAVYLVTVLQVARLGKPPRSGIGTLQTTAQDSSFQVLVVGN